MLVIDDVLQIYNGRGGFSPVVLQYEFFLEGFVADKNPTSVYLKECVNKLLKDKTGTKSIVIGKMACAEETVTRMKQKNFDHHLARLPFTRIPISMAEVQHLLWKISTEEEAILLENCGSLSVSFTVQPSDLASTKDESEEVNVFEKFVEGNEDWLLYCLERRIQPDGRLLDENRVGDQADRFSVFVHEKSCIPQQEAAISSSSCRGVLTWGSNPAVLWHSDPTQFSGQPVLESGPELQISAAPAPPGQSDQVQQLQPGQDWRGAGQLQQSRVLVRQQGPPQLGTPPRPTSPRQFSGSPDSQDPSGNIAHNVEHVFLENGREVRKMPVMFNNETIWVECVPRDSQVKNSSTVGLIG